MTARATLNDPARLAALRAAGLLDAPPERAFDRLSALAATLLHAPVALVSLVDADRQFFASCTGLPEPWATARETPLSHSFCQHVVTAAAPLVITDARAHPLVHDNLAIRDLGVVAYLGVPLVTVEGHAIGSLCVIDGTPRAWTDDDVAVLAQLADLVMTEIALRAEVAERRRVEATFRALSESAPIGIFQSDLTGAVTYTNPRVQQLWGADEEAIHGLRWLAAVHPDDASALHGGWVAAMAAGQEFAREYRVLRSDGSTRYVHGRAAPLRDAGGSCVGSVGTVEDVTERRALAMELTRQASEDELTGLANRSRLRTRMARALTRPPRGTSPAILLVDLDDFKRVNDSLGHGAGDRLLELVADRMLGATRGSDTVARLGGDEFAVLLRGVRGAAEVTVVADRIGAALYAPFLVDGREIRVDASIGVAIASAGESPDDLLRNADLALYQAKATGKGRYAAFAPEMHTAAVARLELEAELRWAIANEELVLHYQPIVHLATRQIVAAEALVRWQHPARGLIPPSEFIPLAEATDLVVPLGRWVLHAACHAVAAWPASAGREEGVSVSVNVSGRQLQRAEFVEEVAAALRASGLAPRQLVLEVTESVLLDDIDAALARLDDLRALGVRLALDDFGTGYSSLAYLQRLPVDILKIDRTFTADVTAGGRRAALARAVVTLADTLGLRTIAEGVETPAQHAELLDLGCQFGQGYLYARPLDRAAIERALAA